MSGAESPPGTLATAISALEPGTSYADPPQARLPISRRAFALERDGPLVAYHTAERRLSPCLHVCKSEERLRLARFCRNAERGRLRPSGCLQLAPASTDYESKTLQQSTCYKLSIQQHASPLRRRSAQTRRLRRRRPTTDLTSPWTQYRDQNLAQTHKLEINYGFLEFSV